MQTMNGQTLLYLLELWQFYFHIDRNAIRIGESIVDNDVLGKFLVAILFSRYFSKIIAWLHDVRLERTYYLVLTIRHLCELRLWGWCFFYWSLHLWLHWFFHLYRWFTQELIC